MGRTIKKGSAYAYRNSTLLMRVLVPFGGFTLLNLVCMYALCRMANGGEMKTGGITAGNIIVKYRLRFGGYRYPVEKNGNLNLRIQEDRLVNQFVKKRDISK